MMKVAQVDCLIYLFGSFRRVLPVAVEIIYAMIFVGC